MLPYDCIVLFCDEIENRLYGSGNLAASQATGANSNLLVGTVYNSIDLSDVCLPGSACFTVGVRNIVSESNTFTAAHTFCHILHLPRKFRTIFT